jgi:hypothetical protein
MGSVTIPVLRLGYIEGLGQVQVLAEYPLSPYAIVMTSKGLGIVMVHTIEACE